MSAAILALVFTASTSAPHSYGDPIPSAYAEKITVFHVNQATYGIAPINMDTADLLGDMYFDMRSKALPIECASHSSASKRDCDNAEVASDNLVITKLVLEVDNRFGQYGRCNVCVNGTDNHGNNSCTDGIYDCDCGGFSGKPTQCGQPVGQENIATHMAGRSCGQGDPNWACWHDSVAMKTGGFWYSTTDTGYCGDGSSPAPAGCTWRVAEFVKRVNKSCSDNAIYNEVELVDKSSTKPCFTQCGDSGVGPTRNTSSPCWITCFYDTVLGPGAAEPHGKVTGMPLADLVAAWNVPFASSDPTKGGCAALAPPGIW